MSDLSFGTRLLLWSIRACATGHGHCPPVVHGMERALGTDGDEGRVYSLSLVQTLAEASQRPLHLSCPGVLGVTYDEIALISAFDAAQKQMPFQRDAQLNWILGTQPPPDLSDAVQQLSLLYLRSGHTIRTPALPQDHKPWVPKDTDGKGRRNVHTLFK